MFSCLIVSNPVNLETGCTVILFLYGECSMTPHISGSFQKYCTKAIFQIFLLNKYTFLYFCLFNTVDNKCPIKILC